jgi:hypothetical protein
VAEAWRIETSDTVHAVEVVRRGACWAVSSDGDHAVLHSTPRIAVQAWAFRHSVMGLVLAPGEPTRAEAVAAERERCARLCDEVVVDCWARSGVVNGPTYAGAASGAKRCAAKIRAGGV